MKYSYIFRLCVLTTASAIVVFSCQFDADQRKRNQYFAEGSRLYALHCANCHQVNGQGVANLYPPLVNADYLNNKSNVACAIRYGLNQPLTVNGKTYTQPMPGNPRLTPIEIAEISTFITNEWGGSHEITTIPEVERALQQCAAP